MKRAFYFGTTSKDSGHHIIPLAGRMLNDEVSLMERIIDSRSFEEMFQEGKRAVWFHARGWFGYGGPYTPDDRRPGGKPCVLVEDGTQEEVKKFIEENVLLKEKFSTVFSIHHYNEKEKDL